MEMNEDGTLGPEHITDRGIELHSVEQGEQVDVKLPWTLTEKECEQFKAFAAVHGLTVLLDHLGLDGLGNEVNDLYGRVRLLEQREKVAYAKILVATNSNLGGYTDRRLTSCVCSRGRSRDCQIRKPSPPPKTPRGNNGNCKGKEKA